MIKSGSNESMRVFDNQLATNKSFFTGHMNLQTLEFDPIVTGYAFIIWTKIPKWMDETYQGNAFQKMTQKNFKSFSGISDMELETEDYTHTFNGNGYGVATSITKNNVDFTIKHQEFSGSPIKNMYQFWVSGIRDPRTGIATYPKRFNCEYAAKNHTGELMYVVTRPDANNTGHRNIEFAAYYTNVFPTKIPLSHFEYDQGSHNLVEIDIPFKGTMNISPKVDAYAQKLLSSTYSFVEEGMFDPEDKYVAGENLSVFEETEGITGDGLGDIATY